MTADDLSKALQEPTDEWSSQQVINFLKSDNESMFAGRSALNNNCGTPPW